MTVGHIFVNYEIPWDRMG